MLATFFVVTVTASDRGAISRRIARTFCTMEFRVVKRGCVDRVLIVSKCCCGYGNFLNLWRESIEFVISGCNSLVVLPANEWPSMSDDNGGFYVG